MCSIREYRKIQECVGLLKNTVVENKGLSVLLVRGMHKFGLKRDVHRKAEK